MAKSPAEVNTLVLIRRGFYRIGHYVGAQDANHRIVEWDILEYPSRRMIARRIFGGQAPPDRKLYNEPSSGSEPNPRRMRQWLYEVLRTGKDPQAAVSQQIAYPVPH